MEQDICEVSSEVIDCARLARLVEAPGHGARNFFFGSVRDVNQGRAVLSVTYDAFVPLAIEELRHICAEARQKWGEHLKIVVFHRTGNLKVGELSVGIGVGSPHRDESYQASRYVIEQIKVRVPIWKKEHYTDGESQWVKGHELCQHA